MKIIFWGVGEFAQNICSKMEVNKDFYIDDIIFFCDNNSDLWGEYFFQKEIKSPQEVQKNIFDYVVILSIYEKAIRNCLQNELGISEEKILTYREYYSMCHTRYAYLQRYGNEKCTHNTVFNTKRLVVYTSITGNYDDLQDPLFIDPDIEYVCFTNNREIKSNIWNVEYISDNDLSDMMLAKKMKLFPHELFKEYDTSVWVDGKFQIIEDVRTYIMEYEKSQPMLCFPHFERNCIYSEASECILREKGKKEQILHQISDYYKEAYPVDNGLYEMGCIVRNHNDERVINLMEQWYNQIEMYSNRDQISFPYVCWKNDFLPDICDRSINRNKWMVVKKHKMLG